MWSDLRLAIRRMGRSPAFSIAAIWSLAAGVGASTALFCVFNALVLKPLPVPQPERLVEVAHSNQANFHSYAEWSRIRDRQDVFTRIAGFGEANFNLASSGEKHAIPGIYVTGDYFATIGIKPVRGRFLIDSDNHAGAAPVCIIGYRLWELRYGKADTVLGQEIVLDGTPFEIVGVAPEGFFGTDVGYSFDFAIPYEMQRVLHPNGTAWHNLLTSLSIIGRLAPGVSVQHADAEMRSLGPGILAETIPAHASEAYRQQLATMTLIARPMTNGVLSSTRYRYGNAVKLMFAIVCLLQLIACVNLANLTIARSISRQKEFAMRFALGVTRLRLMRQLLAETLVMVAVGTVGGVALAAWAPRVLVSAISSSDDPHFLDLHFDSHTVIWMAAVSVLSLVFIGVFPALRAMRSPTLPNQHPGSGQILHARFSADAIPIAAQAALSMVLVVSAVMMVRTVHQLTAADLGFQQHGLLHVETELEERRADWQRDELIATELLARLRSIPKVTSAARTKTQVDPAADKISTRMPSGREREVLAYVIYVDEHYLPTMRIPLISGHNFGPGDTGGSDGSAVLSRAAAAALFGSRNPLGSEFTQTSPSGASEVRVIGIVGDAQYGKPKDAALNVIYRPVTQCRDACAGVGDFYIRYDGNMAELQQAVAVAARDTDPRLMVDNVPLEQESQGLIQQERLTALLASAAGGFALLLAAIGIYGVTSLAAELRRKEIGIRLALGAQPRHVHRAISLHTFGAVIAGAAAGGAMALPVSQALREMLYGVVGVDPLSFLTSGAVLFAIAFVAGIVPVQHAIAADPMETLRTE